MCDIQNRTYLCRPPIDYFALKKILIIRFSSIGDIVLTSPVVRCIRQSMQDVEIHYLTKSSFSSIMENNPIVDKVHSYNKSIREVIPDLKKEKFDFVVDLHNNLRSARVKFALRRPSATFPKLNFKKWLLVNFKKNYMPRIHIVDRYFKAVEQLGVTNDGQGLDFFISVKERVVPEITFGWPKEGYVALVVGAAHFTKRIPIEMLRSICRKIDLPIVAIGGKEDSKIGEKLATEFKGKVYNACGKCTLNQSASVIKNAHHVITADTGMMHIAAAFQKPITVLWGNTVPQLGMYPYMPSTTWQSLEVEGLDCRPCSKIGFQKCPKGHFRCMMDQNTSLIRIGTEALEKLRT